MKSILKLAAIGCVLLGQVSSADTDGLRGKIPFSFVAMDRQMPEGEYTVTIEQFGNRVLLDNGFDQRGFVLSMTTRQMTEGQKGLTLVFHRYGDRYFLRQVNSATKSVELAPSPEEKWVKRAAKDTPGSAKMALVRVALR